MFDSDVQKDQSCIVKQHQINIEKATISPSSVSVDLTTDILYI